MGWANLHAGAVLLDSKRTWTEVDLLGAIDVLWGEISKGEQRGYGSDEFFFYDGGFAEIAEVLRDRLGIPQEWEIALGVRVDPKERRRFWNALAKMPRDSRERQRFLEAHAADKSGGDGQSVRSPHG